MDLNLILNIVEIAAILVVGIIFRSQIQSQKATISNMEKLSKLMDIDKIERYSIMLEKLAKYDARWETIEFLRKELDSGRYDNELKGIKKEMFIEYVDFTLKVFISSNKDNRVKIASKFSQNNQEILYQIARKFDETS